MISRILIKTALSLACVLVSDSAFAHAHLQKATPAVGGTVAAASEIRLEFSEGVEAGLTSVTLAKVGGGAIALGQARTEGANRSVFVVPIAAPLATGDYAVHWHAVAVDTHQTQGDFTFTIKP